MENKIGTKSLDSSTQITNLGQATERERLRTFLSSDAVINLFQENFPPVKTERCPHCEASERSAEDRVQSIIHALVAFGAMRTNGWVN